MDTKMRDIGCRGSAVIGKGMVDTGKERERGRGERVGCESHRRAEHAINMHKQRKNECVHSQNVPLDAKIISYKVCRRNQATCNLCPREK